MVWVGLGLVDLVQTGCTEDCLRATVVIVVPNKRQITSPLDAVPFTAHLGIKDLIDLDDKTRAWLENNALEWCLMAHASRRRVGFSIRVMVS